MLFVCAFLLCPEPAAFQGSLPPVPLRIAEFLPVPTEGDALEFVELLNAGQAPLDLTGVKIQGIAFTFGSARLEPGQRAVLISDANPAAFQQAHPGVAIAAIYSGRLSNTGERLALVDRDGRTIESITYGTGVGWPSTLLPAGSSYERIDFDADARDMAGWRPSRLPGGTPGAPYAPPSPRAIQLSELMATAPDDQSDWVELVNVSDSPQSLAGWSLSDNLAAPRLAILPQTTPIAPGARLTINAGLGQGPGTLSVPWRLDAAGESLWLFDDQTNLVDAVTFGNQPAGLSTARVNARWRLAIPTPSGPNQLATTIDLASLRINEWLADALPSESDWIELFNPHPQFPAALEGSWILTGTGLQQIRVPTFLGPQQFLLLEASERPRPTQLDFKLPAAGGFIALLTPTGAQVDRIDYRPQSEGLSGGRLPDGSDTVLDLLLGATPGQSNATDADHDGLPDAWERAHGLDPTLSADAQADPDLDGASNRDEWRAGTSPLDPSSTLRLTIAAEPTGPSLLTQTVRLSFPARPGLSYSLLRKTDGPLGLWSKLADFPPLPAGAPASESDAVSPGPSHTLYAVRSPALQLPGEPDLWSITPTPADQLTDMTQPIRLLFHPGVDPQTALPANLTVERAGTLIPYRARFGASYRALELHPTVPWPHASEIRVELGDGLKSLTGQPLTGPASWSFLTGPALPLVENKALYESATDTVHALQLRIVESPGGYTFQDVLDDVDRFDGQDAEVPVLVHDDLAPSGTSTPNAVISQRGDLSRTARLKSFRIEFNNGVQPWRGYRVVHLLKSPFDPSRARNRLSYALLAGLPDITSLRTSWVRLRIDDADYGLYTQVENPDQSSLQAHALDPDAHYYKAVAFNFLRYPDHLRLRSDPLYSEADFEQVLQIRGSRDHAKILAMIEDFNTPGQPVAPLLARHFELENLTTWWAFNLLVGNQDSNERNFLLYSPAADSTWYLAPWDYDFAFSDVRFFVENGGGPRWIAGLANWASSRLFRLFLSEPPLVAKLLDRVDRMRRNELAPDRIRALITPLQAVVTNQVLRPPDLDPNTTPEAASARIAGEFALLPTLVDRNHAFMLETLERPLPVHLLSATPSVTGWLFDWEDSFDLQGDGVTYDFELAHHPGFGTDTVLHRTTTLTRSELQLSLSIPPGDYFWRVIVRDTKNPTAHWQLAYATHWTPDGVRYNGVAPLIVP